MSEQALSTAAAPLVAATQPELQQPQSAGALLRQLRESAGVDLGLLASALKVSQTKLLALESDQYHELPDLTFARGLAASICRAFGVDAAPVLALMPTASNELNPLQNALNAPLKRSGKGLLLSWAKSVPRSLLLMVGLLLLGSALLWLWPTLPIRLDGEAQAVIESDANPVLPADGLLPGLQTGPFGPAEPEPEPDSEAVDAVEASADLSAEAQNTTEPSDGLGVTPVQAQALSGALLPSLEVTPPVDRPPSLPALAGTRADAQAPAADAQTPDPSQDVAPPETAETAPQAVDEGAAEGGLLRLMATAESWVSVQDAEGQSLINRTLKAGDAVSLEGAKPLSVVIGRKDAVRVSVRGQDFDHLNLSRSSVARFQVE